MKRNIRSEKARDKLIEAAYVAECSGIAIDIMKIGDVFKEGHRLIDAGANFDQLREGIRKFVDVIARV
jgi:hypothetical protein